MSVGVLPRGMRSSVTTIADDWWARDFACSAAELRPTRTRVQEHAGALLGNSGIWILVAGGAPVISLPTDNMNALAKLAQSWSVSDVEDPVRLQARLASSCTRPVDKIVGPAFISYGSSDSLDLREARVAQPVCLREPIDLDRHSSAPSGAQSWASSRSARCAVRAGRGLHSSIPNAQTEYLVDVHRKASRLRRIRILRLREVAGAVATRGGRFVMYREFDKSLLRLDSAFSGVRWPTLLPSADRAHDDARRVHLSQRFGGS